jgi:hypothetical protein
VVIDVPPKARCTSRWCARRLGARSRWTRPRGSISSRWTSPTCTNRRAISSGSRALAAEWGIEASPPTCPSVKAAAGAAQGQVEASPSRSTRGHDDACARASSRSGPAARRRALRAGHRPRLDHHRRASPICNRRGARLVRHHEPADPLRRGPDEPGQLRHDEPGRRRGDDRGRARGDRRAGGQIAAEAGSIARTSSRRSSSATR